MASRLISLLLAAFCASLIAAGCGGHKGTPPPADQPGTPEFSAALTSAKLARLATAPVPANCVITGTIALSGMTILSDAGLPLPAGLAVGSIQVRIVDPQDDILSISQTNPNAQGGFMLEVPASLGRVQLELRFRVQADLDGDSTAADTVRERFVLDLAGGKQVSANFDLREQTGLQPGTGTGAQPEVIVAQVAALDASGKHAEARASVYSAGNQVVDVDGDGKFDALRDLTLPDADANSLPDANAALYAKAEAYSRLYGLVTRVDEFQRTLDLLVKDDATTSHSVTVSLDPQAAVELYLPSETLPAAKFGQLNLGQFLVGRNAYVDGYFTDGATKRALAGFALTVLQPAAATN